ncbi:aminotransferase, class i/classii [Grosmannia clavigera kw1407]|uniref:Aminotransferase, class i/classii n=1 Tax=Grosmannia clavigera (strain kw1407 / UAMH 11150) TaxID=655863 RepID=F0XAH1_GROCL|nr:aminotransferase, class i/classii [Grosmannia clavigera kw1407]EFX05713.1 aminotransferase, class i/classii [Grosmannia clavigera kw1407]
MVRIEPFEVEQWMDTYETTPGVINISETCAASVSIEDLVRLAETEASASVESPLSSLAATKMTYGAIRGSELLRQRVAAVLDSGKDADVPPLPSDGVVITQGAIAANHLLFYALISPGDHVICVYPTYQQLYGVPTSLGADITPWKLKAENGYVPDPDELDGLVQPNTKMIVINNPNNPLGVPIPRPVLEQIVAIVRARDIIILSDEVYLPLWHDEESTTTTTTTTTAPPSILTLGYDQTVATGSMSKAFALAGLRIGWVASRNRAIMQAVLAARDYTTISVSQLDDGVARFALSNAVRIPLLQRNIRLAQTNVRLLAAFVARWQAKNGVCSWQRPTAGTTAFVQFVQDGQPVNDDRFCIDVLEATKVLLVPGSRCFGGGLDFRGYVRIGYACETAVLAEGLARLDGYLTAHLSAK